ncbi:MAG: hypothetical protein EPN47_21000 [Acidobacteria bacterium]|nr:MAG: hypothetical protein EPN47_21000 [Acidobacteriota bacterium]
MRLFRITAIGLAFAVVATFADSTVGWAYARPPDSTAADAVPKIVSVQPSSAQPGNRITVKIAGVNLLSGAYVSFSDPAIHVLATRRTSETELEVDIAVGEMAKPQSVVLYVSNPSGASAQTAFAITAATPAASPPQQSQSTSANGPVVTKVDPPRAAPGSEQSIKVTGKNFKEGAKIAFTNPGIRVKKTEFKKSTQLIAQIEVAPNAPAGKTSLFVINPDDSEVEAAFEVGGGSSTGTETAGKKTSTPPATTTQQFSVYNLGDATSIFQDPGKAKGELGVKSGKLQYEQDGQVVFTAKPAEIQEIAPNVFFGLNTGTFHIILTSGKRYNFVASSLAPADTNSIIESLRSALK